MTHLHKNHLKGMTIFLLVLGISVAHYTTPVSHHQWHEIFRRLYFIPILMASLRYGFRDGLLVALLITFIYLPHVIFQWSGSFSMNLVRFNEILLYLLIGGLSGYLSEKTRKERDNYRKTALERDQAYRQLEKQTQQVLELENQLRSADRLAVLGEMTASLAHEVKNPLGSIKGASEILRKRCNRDTTSLEFTQVLLDETDRLNQVVNRYLSMAHPTAQPEEVSDLTESIASVIQMLNPQLKKNKITIETDWPEDPLLWQITEVETRQIFLNLMLNSIAVLKSGGHIKITIQKTGSGIRILFSDTGPGIPEENIPLIFNPFFSTKKEGSGLGLAIVRRIIESKKGSITAGNSPGGGLTFTVIFKTDVL